MSDGYLLSPYGNPSELVVPGVARGLHLTRPDTIDKRLSYEADLVVKGVVPLLYATRSLVDHGPALFGPRLPSPAALPRHTVRSPGFGFPGALFDEGAGRSAIMNGSSLIDLVWAQPHGGEDTRLIVIGNDADDPNAVTAMVAFVRALATRMAEIAASGARFADAWDALRARGLTGEPGEDRMREVKLLVDDLVRLVHGTTERVADRLESRLELSAGGLEIEGELKVRWCDPTVTSVDVTFQGALPPFDVAEVRLAPEPKGFLAFLRTLGELEVDDRALDDAFLIQGSAAATPVVLHARKELLALARHGAHVSFSGNDVTARLFAVPARDDELAPTVEALLELWRRSALHRAGVRDEGDPDVGPALS